MKSKAEHCAQGDEAVDRDSSGTSEEMELPRRSKRSTAGKHPNPHNLPRSVLATNTGIAATPQTANFKELSDAIANLGERLGASLSATLSQSWSNANS